MKQLQTHRIKHLKSRVAVLTMETEIPDKCASLDNRRRSTAVDKDLTSPFVIVKVDSDDENFSLSNGKANGASAGGDKCSSQFTHALQESSNSMIIKRNNSMSVPTSLDNRYSGVEKESFSSCEEQTQDQIENITTGARYNVNSKGNRVSVDFVRIPGVKIAQTDNLSIPNPGNVEDSERLSQLSSTSKVSQTFITDGSQQYVIGNEEVMVSVVYTT